MTKIFYGFLILFILFVASIVTVISSSIVIDKIAKKFAPDYNLTYKKISGNIFTGIKVDELRYDNKMISKDIVYKWDPISLLQKKISIKEIKIVDADIAVIESLIVSFDIDSNSSNNSKFEPFPFEIIVDKVLVSLTPFEKKGISLSQFVLNANDVKYRITGVEVENLELNLDSNLTQLSFKGTLRHHDLVIEDLSLRALDTQMLQDLIASFSDSNNTSLDKNNTQVENETSNPFIPKTIVIKSLYSTILPLKFDPIQIFELALNAKDITFNVEKSLVKNATIDISGTTNLSNFKHKGEVKENQLLGNIVLSPHKELFELYNLPLRQEAIDDISIDFNASEEQVMADVRATAKQILITESLDANQTGENASKAFNLDMDSLLSHVVYTIKSNTLVADTKLMITTPYAKDVSITNKFVMDDDMQYTGAIKADVLVGFDANLTKLLDNLTIQYSGDLESIKTDILSDGLKGSFNSSDFKQGALHIETSEALLLDKMLVLPPELNGSKVNTVIDVPLDFENITPLNAKVKIISNITNIDADIIYGDTLEAKITSEIPEDSLLKKLDENMKWDAIDPLVINVNINEKDALLKVRSKILSSDMNYTFESENIDGQIKLAGLTSNITGNTEEKIMIRSDVSSIKSLLDNVQTFYTLEELPPLKGALTLSLEIDKLKQINILLSSPKIVYRPDRETEHVLNDVHLVVSADESKVELNSYAVTYDEMKIFSTKPSLVNIKDETIEISEFWLNDELKVVGTYNTKTKQGDISADASTFHIGHKMIELDTAVNIKTKLNEEKTSVKGEITLLGGDILYDLSSKTYPSDSDILIVQELKKEQASPFMDNLNLLVKVKTKKPLIYKQGPIDIKAKVDLGLHKAEHAQPMVLGEVIIMKGGSYTFEGKKFVLDKSHIYFTGDPNKPLLDMSVKYKSLNHLITIGISGTPATPNITFSSKPSLSKEQILSIILFDSKGAAGTNSGEDMMKMMGGAMAKSALSDMGIKLDHLVIGSDGSVEVGKKITDKITFIYVNDIIPEVRVKYQHTRRWESVISADEESQSYDIIYKKDF